MTGIRHYSSPLGGILLAADDIGLTGLWFGGAKYCPPTLTENFMDTDAPALSAAVRWLNIYFSGKEPDFLPPLHLVGTPFRKSVWEILLTIPYGRTATYGDISARLAEQRGIPRMSAQAVGGAVGHNPISVIVPCHRVVGANGSLTGYAGGIERKLSLLVLERADTASLFVPERGTAL